MAPKGLCHMARGAYVGKVSAGGAAEQGGLQSGDVIVAVGGRSVQNAAELEALVARLRPGLQLPVRYVRGEQELDTTLPL
jgi:S1-C subfamily serine protease